MVTRTEALVAVSPPTQRIYKASLKRRISHSLRSIQEIGKSETGLSLIKAKIICCHFYFYSGGKLKSAVLFLKATVFWQLDVGIPLFWASLFLVTFSFASSLYLIIETDSLILQLVFLTNRISSLNLKRHFFWINSIFSSRFFAKSCFEWISQHIHCL